jgi:hypothetical protein
VGGGELDEAVGSAMLGDEHGAVLLVALARVDHALGRKEEPPSLRSVEERAEERRGVEARKAQPGHRSVSPDERRRRPVAN